MSASHWFQIERVNRTKQLKFPKFQAIKTTTMKPFFSFLLFTALVPMAVHASTIVNVDASQTSSVNLGPGTYDISVIGTAQGGEFNGWDTLSQLCNRTSSEAWSDAFGMKVGNASTTYELIGSPTFSSAATALSAYEHGILYKNGVTPTASVDDMVVLTVPKSTTIQFELSSFDADCGGVSLLIDPTLDPSIAPEPSTFGLMALMAAGGIYAARRKFSRS